MTFWKRHRRFLMVLVLQAIGVFIWYRFLDGRPVHPNEDSKVLLEYDWSFPAVLNQLAVPGYPAFLRILRVLDPQFFSLPALQLLFHLFAVLFFAAGLLNFGFSGIAALAAASPLFYGNTIRDLHPSILTDSLGCSLSLVTVAWLLMAVRRPSNKWTWGGLALSLFCTYQVRYTYISFIGLVPVLGVVLGVLRYGVRRWIGVGKTILCRLGLVSLAPFVLYCGLRWCVVGHFSLVSFGGYNIVGIVSEFLNPADIPTLAPEFRPLTQVILQQQAERHMLQYYPQGYRMLSYQGIAANYNTYIWKICVPYLQAQAKSSSEINVFLTRFSKAVLFIHAVDYWHWITEAFIKVLGRFPNPIPVICLCVTLVATYICRKGVARSAADSLRRPCGGWSAAVILAIGLGHFISQIGLVILVEPPILRYSDAAYLYLSSMLLAGIAANIAAVRR